MKCKTRIYETNLIAEVVKLVGEGEYNLDSLKEIKVTDSYLGLDQEERGCQNEEAIDNCTSRQYHNTILGKCRCLPLNMRASHKVNILILSVEIFFQSTKFRKPVKKCGKFHTHFREGVQTG